MRQNMLGKTLLSLILIARFGTTPEQATGSISIPTHNMFLHEMILQILLGFSHVGTSLPLANVIIARSTHFNRPKKEG